MRWLILAVVLSLGVSARPALAQHDAGHDAGHGAHAPHIGEDVSAAKKNPAEFQTDLALFTLAVFGFLFLGLYMTAWPKITNALDAREAGIRKAITDAEQAQVAAAEMIRQHQARLDSVQEEVKGILAEARRDAERTKNDIVASANTEATSIKNRAIGEISRAKDQALNELFDKMATQVAAATEHVIGRTVTSDDQNRYIREALAQVGNN